MRKLNWVFEKVKPLYDHGDPAHDLAHVTRVLKICKTIGTDENARLEILLPAAILHDVVNIPKDHPDRAKASQLAADKAKQILLESKYSASETHLICQIIEEHGFSAGKKPSTLESAILQDADRLDALGAIGIMRAISCGAKLGSVYYDLNEPIPDKRPLNDKKFMIDHFFVKLFKLPGLMNTQAGRAEAETRVKFMHGFLKQLESEIQPAKDESQTT